jgi:replicative DNA helicase
VQADVSRCLPNARESERALICAALANPGAVLAECDLSPEVFYHGPHGRLWGVLKRLHDSGTAVDSATITEAITDPKDCGELLPALSEAMASQAGFPSAAANYAAAIREAARRRQVIELAFELTEGAYNRERDLAELQGDAMRRLADIGNEQSTVAPLKEHLKRASAEIEAAIANPGNLTGLDTGFSAVNHLTQGLHAPDLVLIAARPSQGKTTLAVNVACNIADTGAAVGVFSLEQSGAALAKRMVAASAAVNMRRLRGLPEAGQADIANAITKLARLPVYLDDFGGHSVATIRAEARRMVARWGVRAVFVDYLQIIRQTNRKATRYEHLTETSAELKRMAKELGVCVVALSQLSRHAAQEGRRPRLDDLRESGALEQDADLVLLLSGEPADDELPASLRGRFDDDERRAITVVDVAKNREGATGLCFLHFNREITRYNDLRG